ncbi:hypothetical protein IY145_13710 [Methylosinus sp. H3A]|uniref:hypothetical protein n=1 Tax=Methylosinus sp. H3A TaxID=2785786 RepID=UPI0018C22828|nr:hypothetical protein [Methylosinus sp. H3A]MBG0810427.1 hypothetical protein [Methylosinus sp. H3A]
MRRDDEIEKAIAAGERNAEVMTLMHNWCSHARAKRMGGAGMIEQMTGLPISHFSMECDHAPMGGMACWDFGESSLDFYDRNCVTCTIRQPVGLPNLSKLVAEREEARRIAYAREQVERNIAEQALKQRNLERAGIRKNLDAINQALLDDLEAYDRSHDDVDRTRLVEAARMAPERLDPQLIDLIFNQSGAATSLALLALDVGAAVVPNERRLLLLAQRLLRSGIGAEAAAQVLMANLAQIEDGDVPDLVPAVAELASPDHREFFGGHEPRSDSRLLLAMWKEKPKSVTRGIEQLLERKTVAASQLVGRSIRLIIEHDPPAAKDFVLVAAARYVRAKQLLSDLGEHESLGDMAGALNLMLDLEPKALDTVLQDLSAGANIEAKRNIAKIYSEAWRGHYSRDKEKRHPEARLKLGLDRLTWLPSQLFEIEILSTVASAFRYPPDEVWPFIEEHADKLVGAALLIDEQVVTTEGRQGERAPIHEHLERRSLRSAAYQVAENFLKAAAKASKSETAKARFIEAVQAIPHERELLRGIALRAAMEMAGDVAGLKAVLPMLYSGLVGASVLGRGEAALALSEIPARGRQNLPPLVFEAFCALLLDQFIFVHKNAVRSLRRISLPEDLKPRVAFALFHLVTVYSESEKDDDFLVDCIDELARRADHLPNPDKVRDFCCHATLKAEPLYVRSDSRGLRYSLKASDDFALVVAHVLPEYAGNFNRRDDEAELIRAMSPESVRKHKGRLVEVAKALADSEMWLSTLIADALYRAGAEADATGLLAHMAETFGATVKDKGRVLFVGFPLLAYRMEEALVARDDQRWAELANEWEAKVSEQEALMEERHARDSRSGFSIPH